LFLRSLKVSQVRNLASTEIEPVERFNVFHGDNGQGKTNLLEAIYAVGTLRSFRATRLADMIAVGEENAYIGARLVRGDLERHCELMLGQGARRVRLDGKAVRPIAKYFGEFNVVLFAPEDLQIPRGSPGDRRRFLDRAVFNQSAEHLQSHRDYEKALRNRNAFLRRQAEMGTSRSTQTAEMLEVLDEQIAALGASVVAGRVALLGRIRPVFQKAFAAITQAGLEVDAAYESPEPMEGLDRSDLQEALLRLLSAARRTDLARGQTTVGPHRDDLRFFLAGQPAQSFASQGQLRAMVLAWKTAELELFTATRGEPPVLLLDDVSSELDRNRNEFLFEFLRAHDNQCFITTTHPDHVLLSSDRADYEVRSGIVTRQNKG
jgi:DNA replication and repair protein RecF